MVGVILVVNLTLVSKKSARIDHQNHVEYHLTTRNFRWLTTKFMPPISYTLLSWKMISYKIISYEVILYQMILYDIMQDHLLQGNLVCIDLIQDYHK